LAARVVLHGATSLHTQRARAAMPVQLARRSANPVLSGASGRALRDGRLATSVQRGMSLRRVAVQPLVRRERQALTRRGRKGTDPAGDAQAAIRGTGVLAEQATGRLRASLTLHAERDSLAPSRVPPTGRPGRRADRARGQDVHPAARAESVSIRNSTRRAIGQPGLIPRTVRPVPTDLAAVLGSRREILRRGSLRARRADTAISLDASREQDSGVRSRFQSRIGHLPASPPVPSPSLRATRSHSARGRRGASSNPRKVSPPDER